MTETGGALPSPWTIDYPRRIPARRPQNHEPRAPRWMATFVEAVSMMTADYIAIQTSDSNSPESINFLNLIRSAHRTPRQDSPEAWELTSFVDGAGRFNLVHIGYWRDPNKHAAWILGAPLGKWFTSLDARHANFGAWRETIQVPVDRLETIVSKEGWSFGLANCPMIEMRLTTTNGYFGAARDRFPLSAIDRLEAPSPHRRRATPALSLGRRLRAECGHNTAVIRSGQHWASSLGEQLVDYESSLQPKLMAGMDHLSRNQETEGVLSLRVMTNHDLESFASVQQTSVLAYFNSLEPLEKWAESHATHAAIYEHAIDKQREFGADRQVVTWHEVFIVTRNSNFEYVNCHADTGILPFAQTLMAVDDAN